MDPFVIDEKPQYSRLSTSGDNIDNEPEPSDAPQEMTWRTRFMLLLVTSLTIVGLLLGATVYQLSTLTCLPSWELPGAKIPYCKTL